LLKSDFSLQIITNFRWAPDGKRLAVARSQSTSDVILLHETQP
jgi:hypothetical protein